MKKTSAFVNSRDRSEEETFTVSVNSRNRHADRDFTCLADASHAALIWSEHSWTTCVISCDHEFVAEYQAGQLGSKNIKFFTEVS